MSKARRTTLSILLTQELAGGWLEGLPAAADSTPELSQPVNAALQPGLFFPLQYGKDRRVLSPFTILNKKKPQSWQQ